MDYKEIRKHHLKSVLKHLLADWLKIFSSSVLLISLLIIAFVGFNKMSIGTEIQKRLLTIVLTAIWLVIPIFYNEVKNERR